MAKQKSIFEVLSPKFHNLSDAEFEAFMEWITTQNTITKSSFHENQYMIPGYQGYKNIHEVLVYWYYKVQKIPTDRPQKKIWFW